MDQKDVVVALLRGTLGEGVVGVYLHGSSVFGGLRPSSDLDILAVTTRSTTPEERGSLIARLLPISGRGDPTGRSRSIELTIVVQADVRPWHYPPPLDFQYGDWWRQEFQRGDLAPWTSPNPDLALVLEMVLRANHPLYGPPPAEVVDPVPAADYRQAMIDCIPALMSDLDGDERNVLLTLARIWTTLATGAIRSKDEAAGWAVPLLERARAMYVGEAPDEVWGDLLPRVRPLANFMLGEIEAQGSRG
jgi:streptomycin 3"-adenylyltransferase